MREGGGRDEGRDEGEGTRGRDEGKDEGRDGRRMKKVGGRWREKTKPRREGPAL
jgi:hypothetical protein